MNENSNLLEIRKKIKQITGIYLSIFLIVILFISLYINVASFQKQFIANELSFYSIRGDRLVEKIENGLLYGKTLDKFYGVDQIIEDWCKKNREVVKLQLLSEDKQTVLYQLTRDEEQPETAKKYGLYLEIRGNQGDLQGYFNLTIDLKERMAFLLEKEIHFFFGTAILLSMGIVALVIFCKKGSFIIQNCDVEKKKILQFVLLLVFVLEVAFTLYASSVSRQVYLEMFHHTRQEIQVLVQHDVDSVIEKGVAVNQIYEFGSYTKEILQKVPMIDDIRLNGERVSVFTSKSYVEHTVLEMLINLLTLLIIAMFLAAEMINYIIISINTKVNQIRKKRAYDKERTIRVCSFLIHVACYLPVSFIPIMMDEYTKGKVSDFILGLPVMILFGTGFIFTILAGNWCVNYGWKQLLLTGIGLMAFSAAVTGLIENAVALVIARGIYGAAYALIYVSISEFAVTGGKQENLSESLSQVTGGLYAGVTIGSALGSIIFESIGVKGVFFLAALIALAAFILVKRTCIIPDDEEVNPVNKKELTKNSLGLVSVLKNRQLIWLALFIIVPLGIMSLYFEYFLPVYAVKAEISSADIGRAFLVDGIMIAYVSPLVIKGLARKINEKMMMCLFTMLMALGFVMFGLIGGVAGILCASGIMGIAEGIALVAQNMTILELDIARNAGTGRMLSVNGSVRKLSQTFGPQVFAAFTLIGYQFGMIAFGSVMILLVIIYLLKDKATN